MKVLEAEFVKGFIRMCDDGFYQNWHERNGGNLSYRIKPEEVEETAAFVAKNCTNITGMELLPYHKLGRGKYYSLGREYEMESTVPPTTEKMNELNEILNKYDIPIFKF